jgi:hypothetical protein
VVYFLSLDNLLNVLFFEIVGIFTGLHVQSWVKFWKHFESIVVESLVDGGEFVCDCFDALLGYHSSLEGTKWVEDSSAGKCE